MTSRFVLPAIIAFACGTVASAHHHHVTISTPSGTAGEAIQIVVGYYADEADLTIVDGLIMDGDEPFVLNLPATFADGPLAGMLTGTGISLTSDFFADQGLLEGGDFAYQLADVTPVDSPDAVMAWCHTDERRGSIIIGAMSNARDAIGQSFHVGVGGHPHGQIVALSAEGTYAVTLVAWDLNGVYADSAPVTMLVHAELNLADIDANGEVDAEDLALLLGAWGTPEADINGDGTTDSMDLGILLGAWG